jgi:hypothetical protein
LAVLLRSKTCERAKVLGLGIFFSFVGFVILLIISTMPSTANLEPAHAIGVSVVVAGMIEALFSPITLLVIVVAFVAATWLTRKTSKHTSNKNSDGCSGNHKLDSGATVERCSTEGVCEWNS